MWLSRRNHVDTVAQEFVDDLDHVNQRSPQPIEFPDSDHVDPRCVGVRQQPVKAGAPRGRARDDIRVFTDHRPAAPRRKLTEFLKLQVEFLSGRTDTTVKASAGGLADRFVSHPQEHGENAGSGAVELAGSTRAKPPDRSRSRRLALVAGLDLQNATRRPLRTGLIWSDARLTTVWLLVLRGLPGLDLNQRPLGYEPFSNRHWGQRATNNAS